MFRSIIFLFVIITLSSCDNELDLLEESREIPVVYALMDASAHNQYFRIERAFADPVISATEIAQNPDSLYYDNAVVELINTTTGTTHIMEKVDGDAEGFPREDGAFAQSPNYLYKIPTQDIRMNPGDNYTLSIKGVDGLEVSSSITIITPPFFSSPIEGTPIRIVPDKQMFFGWNPQNGNEVFTFLLKTHYTEFSENGEVDKVDTWLVEKAISVSRIDMTNGVEYFQHLSNALEADPAISREFESITLELISGDINVYNYLVSGDANLGITSSGEVPAYSNVTNARGIFGSIHTFTKEGMQLNAESLEELKEGDYTADLNFR